MDTESKDHVRILAMQAISKLRMKSHEPEVKELLTQMLTMCGNSGSTLMCGEFVRRYNSVNGIDIRPDGIYKHDVLVKNQRAFFHTIYQDYKQYVEDNSLKSKFGREDIGLEFEAILEREWHAKQQNLKRTMAPLEDMREFDQMLRALVRAVLNQPGIDEDGVDFRRAMAFFAHYFWQVMQKLHNGPKAILNSGNESVLMLVSTKQKTGKSTTVRRLVAPFEKQGFVWRGSFARLEDQFSYNNMAYNYIAWFDDADRDKASNMGKFKQLITDDMVSYRAMYSQTEMKLPKIATFIGTSNKSARELIPDNTGLRRIHQIFVSNESVDTGRGIDLDAIAQMDFQRMYRLVPLTEVSPLFHYLSPSELGAYEESIRPRHSVELWLAERDYTLGAKGDGEVKAMTEMYSDFRAWASLNGYGKTYIPNSTSFGHKLEELGGHRGRTAQFRGFWISQPLGGNDG